MCGYTSLAVDPWISELQVWTLAICWFFQISRIWGILGIISRSSLFVNIYTWRWTHGRIFKVESAEMSGVEVKHEKMHTQIIALDKDFIFLSHFKTTELHGHWDQLILHTVWKHKTTNLIQTCILLALTYYMCFLLFLARCWKYDLIHCYSFFPSNTDSFLSFLCVLVSVRLAYRRKL